MSLEISRSYARKVGHEYVGGNKYEFSDIFAAYKETEIPEDASPEDIKRISDNLYMLARTDVESDKQKLIDEMMGQTSFVGRLPGETPEEFEARTKKD